MELAAEPDDTAAVAADDTAAAVSAEAAIDEPAGAAAVVDDTAAVLVELQAAAVRHTAETNAATATFVILLRPELPRRRTESMNKVSLHCDSGGWTGAGWTGAGWTADVISQDVPVASSQVRAGKFGCRPSDLLTHSS